MSVTFARRTAATLLGSTVLLAGATLPAFAAPNDGEIKVMAPSSDTEQPNNEPQIEGCQVKVEMRGFDLLGTASEDVTVTFSPQGSTRGTVSWTPGDTVTLE